MVPSTSMDPFSIFRMVKQSAWPKWAETLGVQAAFADGGNCELHGHDRLS